MTALIAIAFIAVGVVAYIALRNAQDFSDANQVVPGVETKAPKEWAGAHSPEARLHRRLRDAVAALESNSSLDDPAMATIRTDIETRALELDDRLVAVAALPKSQRESRMLAVEKAVHAIESVIGSVVDLRGPSLQSVERDISDVEARMLMVENARAELDALSGTSSSLDALRDEIEESTPSPEPSSDSSPDPSAGTDADPTGDDPSGGERPD